MDWIRILDTAFKVKDVYDKANEVKAVYDYSKKLEKKKKLEWKDLKYYKNDRMEKALKNAQNALKSVNRALRASAAWPQPRTSGEFLDALAKANKFGHDSKQATDAVSKYLRRVTEYGKSLNTSLKALDKRSALIDQRLKTAKALKSYGQALQKAFLTCAKIPSPTGTAQNAEFFSLSQDAKEFAGHMDTLANRLKKLQAKMRKTIAEGRQLEKNNRYWIAYASNYARKSPGSLKKNQKAKVPVD
ncbi:hypothetical protein Q5Y75_27700 [Ruegeria sp. 2205SS24-7]|uniref:hypothetical protein n=1 Tax=Ruegeria discodermiae TaxID=3064389 RepID=UPI002741DD2E|nr:hypothetical protein [Ruegeria sp. 2205SS24-7]MDP5220973.1 hypothetical protein [Ruegeria sp. 2205SS24-7]